jgi:hypothetical protein
MARAKWLSAALVSFDGVVWSGRAMESRPLVQGSRVWKWPSKLKVGYWLAPRNQPVTGKPFGIDALS